MPRARSRPTAPSSRYRSNSRADDAIALRLALPLPAGGKGCPGKITHNRIRAETWVRAEGAFPSIVDQALFDRARTIIDQRDNHYSDAELLALLQAVLEEEGSLSGHVIDERDNMPSSSMYRSRFGSLLQAYTMIGYLPDRDYRYVEINRTLRQSYPKLLAEVTAEL
jgi:hypothetical protein